MRKILEEIQRRNVFRVALVYIIAGWLTMQVVDVMFPALYLPEWMVSAVAAFVLIGFPFAIIFAWAFEMTPDGIKREKDVDRSNSITQPTGKKLNRTAMIILVIAVGFLLLDKFVLQLGDQRTATPEGVADVRPSIAVLPFVNMSDDKENEYFSDGLSEELLNLLAKIPRLHVAGRTSSFKFKGTNEDLRVIGEQLNVSYVLEGSVRKSGTRLRITAQLVDTGSGYHLWSESYDRDLTDIFTVQDEIASAVVSALRVTLLGNQAIAVKRGTHNLEAYNEMLKGSYFLDRTSAENLEKAFAAFQKATKLDPNYARAWVGLAVTEQQRVSGFATNSDALFKDGFDRVRAYADKAIEIDPTNGEAYLAQSIAAATADWDIASAREFGEKALELNPNDGVAAGWLGVSYLFSEMYPLAIEHLEMSIAIDPLYIASIRDLGDLYTFTDNHEKGLAMYQRALELTPDSSRIYGRIARAYLLQNELDKATEYAAKEPVVWVRELLAIVIMGRRDGPSEEWRTLVDDYATRYGDSHSYQLAEMCADAGELDCAFDWLTVAVDVHDPGAPWAFVVPYFDEARKDPRWAEFEAAIKR